MITRSYQRFMLTACVCISSQWTVKSLQLGSGLSPLPAPSSALLSQLQKELKQNDINNGWELGTAVSTLEGIRSRCGSSPTTTETDTPLSLLHDFHDSQTGLCSEGVWHNAMLGIALVKSSQLLQTNNQSPELATHYQEWAKRLATNLYTLNYRPGFGFVKRTLSGIWEASTNEGSSASQDGQPEFYAPNESVGTCNANAAAVVFLSLLSEICVDEDNEGGDGNAADCEVSHMLENCAATFTRQYFDTKAGRFRYQRRVGDDEKEEQGDGEPITTKPFRAVDQAMAILACSRILKLINDNAVDNDNNNTVDNMVDNQRDAVQQRRYIETRTMATMTAESLMDDFGYGMYATEGINPPVNTIGAVGVSAPKLSPDAVLDPDKLITTRNSWHDSIVCFTILASKMCSGGESPRGLIQFLARDYGIVANPDDKGSVGATRQLLLSHNVLKELDALQKPPVKPRNSYSCTQAVWNAVQRTQGEVDAKQGNKPIPGFVDFDAGFRAFQEETCTSTRVDNGGTAMLSNVATDYPNVRLWANTETAAWLLMDANDFQF